MTSMIDPLDYTILPPTLTLEIGICQMKKLLPLLTEIGPNTI